jgi:2-(1,2-epoxy-1,2-dihydrophenyl)acetyl-CoA isomerase
MNETVKLETSNGVAKLILNRPEAFNSFGLEMIQSLLEKLLKISRDRSITGVIITGEGKAFCAGADLKWLSTYRESYADAFYELTPRYHQTILEIRRMGKPVIAAINGIAAGGGFSMALACDFRVMEASAILRHAYTTNGLSIDGGGTFTLPRIVGIAKAMEIAILDTPINAQDALSLGLITYLVEDGQSVERSLQLLEDIQRIPLSSFAASKELIINSFNNSLEEQLEGERKLLSWCAEQPGGQEGVHAFLEKRKPVYR